MANTSDRESASTSAAARSDGRAHPGDDALAGRQAREGVVISRLPISLLDGTVRLHSLDRHLVWVTDETNRATVRSEVGHATLRWRDHPGAVTLTPAGTSRTMTLEDGSTIGTVASIHAKAISSMCGSTEVAKWKPISGERSERIRSTVRAIADWRGSLDPEVLSLLERLLIRTLAREAGGVHFRNDDAWLPPSALARVSTLAVSAGGRLAVSRLADEAGLSASAFSRAFRGATGFTVGDWLLRQRLKTAQALLASTEMSMTEVAERAGMSGAAHLAQLFRSKLSITPGAYRRRARR